MLTFNLKCGINVRDMVENDEVGRMARIFEDNREEKLGRLKWILHVLMFIEGRIESSTLHSG